MKNIVTNLIVKTGLNTTKMFRYGSIACFSLFAIIFFFGEDNVMLAFPIALTSIALSFENIRIKTFKKIFKLLSLDCSLVILSYLATKNLYIGIFINSITIFFIAYFFTFSFNPKIYKPFLMLFIFTSFSHDNINGLLNKLLAIIFGCLLVILLNYIFDKNNKNDLISDFQSIFSLLSLQIENILNSNFDLEIYNNINRNLRNISYSIHISKSSKYLTTLNGKFKLEMYLHISLLNNLLYKEFHIEPNTKQSSLDILNYIASYIKKLEIKNIYSIDSLYFFSNELYKLLFEKKLVDSKNLVFLIKNISMTLYNYKNSTTKELKSHFKPWIRSSLLGKNSLFKQNIFKGSTRLYFSLRLSITLTSCLFFSHLFETSKIIWIAITIMSVMQIYYEETISKSKDRIKGNFIGLSLFIILSFLHIKELAWIVLFLSLFLTYGFKEYYKLSIFTTLASLSVTSIFLHINEVALVRASLVLLGLLIVFLANKFLFPTKIERGIQILISRLLFYNSKFIESINTNHIEDLASILILISLTNEKLYTRNLILKNTEINNLIKLNNLTIIEIAYFELIK
jgi:hypothetical protein